jgi:CubicO group peptidase (beta-lactamase class C family)
MLQSEASGMPIQALFQKYLYQKFNMTQTSYGPLPINPSMVGDVTVLLTSAHANQPILNGRNGNRCNEVEAVYRDLPPIVPCKPSTCKLSMQTLHMQTPYAIAQNSSPMLEVLDLGDVSIKNVHQQL